MIQRLQTIYLLLIAGFMLAMLFLPIAKPETMVEGLFDRRFLWIFPLVYGLVTVLSVIAVFLYKNRKLQIKWCYGILFFLFLSYVLLCMQFRLFENFNPARIEFKISVTFPFIAMIWDILAVNAIKKDEKLVRSADRLR